MILRIHEAHYLFWYPELKHIAIALKTKYVKESKREEWEEIMIPRSINNQDDLVEVVSAVGGDDKNSLLQRIIIAKRRSDTKQIDKLLIAK